MTLFYSCFTIRKIKLKHDYKNEKHSAPSINLRAKKSNTKKLFIITRKLLPLRIFRNIFSFN